MAGAGFYLDPGPGCYAGARDRLRGIAFWYIYGALELIAKGYGSGSGSGCGKGCSVVFQGLQIEDASPLPSNSV